MQVLLHKYIPYKYFMPSIKMLRPFHYVQLIIRFLNDGSLSPYYKKCVLKYLINAALNRAFLFITCVRLNGKLLNILMSA